ncbi:MAG: CDP-glucose 4,6-dehydratase [Gammaproteobacteria bacterium]|nr:CDP-glucose 4,6-dehydratase [Gammaproteobacteria bacterium]
MMMKKIFLGKTVLITGHTGFKGSWLSMWLNSLGAKVVGLSLNIPTNPSNYNVSNIGEFVDDNRIDIRDVESVKKLVKESQPDFIFHLAAQALVRPSYEFPLETLTTNALGTASILEALRTLNKQVTAIMITSDKAYDNVEWIWGYREIDRLGGKDPYSASKGMAELAIRTYVESFFKNNDSDIRIGIVRAGNVIGGGDWAKDRLVPDCMASWAVNKTVDIRSPHSTRPWQHVLEPLSGYLSLASILNSNKEYHGEAYNFGPPAHQNHPVSELIDEMSKYWEHVQWNDISKDGEHLHEAGLLKLNCDKALSDLKWQPTLQFNETVEMTVEWYKSFYQGDFTSMSDFTVKQIEQYTYLAQQRKLSWACND